MIRHIVVRKWKADVSEEEIEAVTAGFRKLKDEIPEIVSYSFGPDAGLYRGNSDYALIAEFETEADLRAYVVHPRHQDFLKNIAGPVLEPFQSAQYIAEQ